jgi:ATP-binding cassette subfamily C protein LapB
VGSGKTTIGKLITKLFLPQSGNILIDGIDIRQLDPSEIRENIGYVSQEPWLIAGTVEQNISLGAADVKSDTIIEAAHISTAEEFINKHTKGFKQVLDERGEGLSGGQKQAITVARALVKKPPIFIFDEPTSSMDAKTEKKFIQNFIEFNPKATLLLITHRTSLLNIVDKVIVVDQGKVVGSGSVDGFLKATKTEKSTLSDKPGKNPSLSEPITS